jgi:hypothetical protein
MAMTPAAVTAELAKTGIPGEEAEFDWAEAQKLGVFVEDALTEQDARDSLDGLDDDGVA